jgi:tol-pal system protein YbgF
MTMMLRTVKTFLMILLALGLINPARATLLGDDEARQGVTDLRAATAALTDRVKQLESIGNGVPGLVNQVEGLQQDISQLRGKVDELLNKLATQDKRAKELYLDLDNRLKALEATTQKAEAEQKAKAEQQAKAPEPSSYDAALVAFNNGDYKASLNQFRAYLTENPKDPKAPNAIYWMGMNQLALKDYLGARATSEDLIHHYSSSPKVPDAMLNLASAQTGLEDEAGARSTLKSLIAKFPDSKAAGLARERLKKPH